MTSHDEILERMSGANPLPDVEMITDGQLAEMTLQLEEARRAGRIPDEPQELRPTRTRVRWIRPAVAFAAAVLVAFAVIGAVSLTTGGESDVADQTSSTTTTETTSPSTTSTVELPPGEWNPVLATIVAGAAPEPAICPAGTDPTAAGPVEDRPAIGSPGLLSAAFDRHAGRVVYVDGAGATWAFDVCTNTWTDLQPSGAVTGNISGGLVYDRDSDVTVSIEHDEIFVYDANSNTWEVRANTSGVYLGPIGTAYDPVSGLVVTATAAGPGSSRPGYDLVDNWLVQAYDVDTDTWHDLGLVPLSRQTPCCTGIDLLGYSVELDRLILTTYVEEDEATLLLDPRTGEMTVHAIPTPVVNLGWPSHDYGQGDTVYVHAADQVVDGRWTDVLCGFDPTAIAWTRCYTAPEQFPALKHDNFDAIVGDPINNRLLLIGSTYYTSVPRGTDDVWAIDLATGDWTEVLAPTEAVAPFSPGEWDSLLATARSQMPPEPASCPAGDDPDRPGPVDQARPSRGTPDDHAAAFDRRTGRIMHVDGAGETWAFDVCTNTWLQLNPAGEPIDQSLVYDVDSDVTVAVGPGDFSVYDARTNTWMRPALEVVGGPDPGAFAGVAYDPISGLIITTGNESIWAYDVDSSRLTHLGAMPDESIGLGGYLPDLDRLVLWIAWSDPVLVDPRTGAKAAAPNELPFLERYHYHDRKGAAAVDTINNRLVVIGSYGFDDVWGIDLDTSELFQLLAPST